MRRSFSRKLVALASVVALLGLVLVSCGGAKKEVTINIWEQHDDTIDKVFDGLIEEFMKANPGIKVVRTHYGTEDLREQFRTAALGGGGPEMIFGPNDNIGTMVQTGILMPLDDMLAGVLKKLSPAAVEASSLEGKVYGLSILVGNTLTLLYNKSMVDKPATKMSEIIALTAKYNDGKTYPMVFNQTEAFWFVTFLGAFGGRVFAADGKTPTLNTPEMKQALAYYYGLKQKGVIPKESDYDVSDKMFKEGKAAYLINGPWSFQGYADALKDKLGIAVLPVVDETGKPILAWNAAKTVSVNANIKDKAVLAAVKKFLEFMATKDFQVKYALVAKESPANLEAMDDPQIKADPFINATANQVKQSIPMPINAEMRAVWDAIGPTLKKVMSGAMTPDAAAEEMQKIAEAKIKEM